MEILNVSKQTEKVTVELSSNELVKLCNILYNTHDVNKNKLYYQLYSEMMIAQDICQYGHIDDFSLECIMKARNSIKDVN